jgi:hypothetical protein
MHQEIAVIAQHPFALFVSLNAGWQFAPLLQLKVDFVGHGLSLARVRARADNKIIGEAGDAGEVKNSDARGLFFLSGANCDAPPGFNLFCTGTVNNCGFGLRQKRAPIRYRTIEVSVFLRFAALAALSIPFIPASAVLGQVALAQSSIAAPAVAEPSPVEPAVNMPVPNETDSTVIRAREVLNQVTRLVASGALPSIRLKKAQDDLQDALDGSMLKKSLYSTDLLPEQAEQMIMVAQRMAFRRQRALLEMQELVSAGVISRSEAEASGVNLERAKSELEWAQTRARLVEQVAESVRLEKAIANMESQAESHPEWAGKVYTKYDGNGIFTPADLKTLETAYLSRFARALPISADGETALHRSLGFDHRGRVDVAVTPDQPEGAWLMRYLESKRIPYFAFRAAVPHQATGAHIHVGPGSTKLALSD